MHCPGLHKATALHSSSTLKQGELTAAVAAPPPGAVVVNMAAVAATARVGAAAPVAAATATVRAAAPAARKALNPRRARLALLALALLLLGFATAYLACFAMTLPLANSGVQGCARTEEEAADMREAAALLLVSASTQVLVATATLLVPALPLAVVAYTVAWHTAFGARDVVGMVLAFACHGHVHGVAAFHYWTFYAVLLDTLLVAAYIVVGRP